MGVPPRVARLCSIHFIVSLAGLRKIVRYTESSLYRSGSLNRGSTVYEHRGAPVVQTLYNACTNLRPFSLGGNRYVPSLNFKSCRVQGHPCGSNDMSLEGKCCWVSDNSGQCLREFDVWNGCYVLCQKPLPHSPPPPSTEHPIFYCACMCVCFVCLLFFFVAMYIVYCSVFLYFDAVFAKDLSTVFFNFCWTWTSWGKSVDSTEKSVLKLVRLPSLKVIC